VVEQDCESPSGVLNVHGALSQFLERKQIPFRPSKVYAELLYNDAVKTGGGLYTRGTATANDTIVSANIADNSENSFDIGGNVTGQNNMVYDDVNLTGINDGAAGNIILVEENSNLADEGLPALNDGLSELGNFGGPTQTIALSPDRCSAASRRASQRHQFRSTRSKPLDKPSQHRRFRGDRLHGHGPRRQSECRRQPAVGRQPGEQRSQRRLRRHRLQSDGLRSSQRHAMPYG
jgi:hypothetical protein